jgi:signal transduction histidine kinase
VTANELLAISSQLMLLSVAIYIVWATFSKSMTSKLNILVFFLMLSYVLAQSWISQITDRISPTISTYAPALLLISLPYVLLRLVRDYYSVPWLIMRLAEIGLIASYFTIIVIGATAHVAILSTLALYFAVFTVYSAYRFLLGAQTANGITRHRLTALSASSFLFAIIIVLVPLRGQETSTVGAVINGVQSIGIMGVAIGYLVGFAPPMTIRRAWQEPELRRFLTATLRMPGDLELSRLLRQIERNAAVVLGAPHAAVGLWNPDREVLQFELAELAPGQTIGGRAFQEQRTILSLDTVRDDPANRELYEQGEAYAVLAAPITSGDTKYGAIAVYSPNAPIFADDDILLLSIIADQIALIIENRKHLEASAEIRAREETARLREEFLSVASHDLRTPLTTIIGTGQYLERRMKKHGIETPELTSIIRLNQEAQRLNSFVHGLLDAARAEQRRLVGEFECADMKEIIDRVIDRSRIPHSHRIDTEFQGDLVAKFDPARMEQVFENLLENAGKYSPGGTDIAVRVSNEGDVIRISVRDHGPGIAIKDRERIFDRFFRSEQSIQHPSGGIGLGLYICREIVEQHDGRIWVEDAAGEGSTFLVEIPRIDCDPTERQDIFEPHARSVKSDMPSS